MNSQLTPTTRHTTHNSSSQQKEKITHTPWKSNLIQTYRERLDCILSQCKNIAVAYHPDADGMSAVKILADYLNGDRKANGDRIPFVIKNVSCPLRVRYYPVNNPARHLSARQEAEVLKWQPDAVVYIDLCNNDPGPIARLREKVRFILSIDHHSFPEKWSENFDVYVNPGLTALKYCAASLMNELFRTHFRTPSPLVGEGKGEGETHDCSHPPLNPLPSREGKIGDDWMEMIGLEGDMITPPGGDAAVSQAAEVLNLLGLTGRDDEDEECWSNRLNRLLGCLMKSDSAGEFLKLFGDEPDLKELHDKIRSDIEINVREVRNLKKPYRTFEGGPVFVHHIHASSGYEIFAQVLKGHFPYREKNSTYLFIQRRHTPGSYRIFISTSHPKMDCYSIIRRGEGGGHRNRAGYGYTGDIHAEIDRVCGMIEKMIESVAQMPGPAG